MYKSPSCKSQAICVIAVRKKYGGGAVNAISENSGFIWFKCAGCNVNLIPHSRSKSKKKKV